jgi:hypothetical protein
MASKTFEIFKTLEDREKWDKHLEHVDAIEEFTTEQKEKIKEGISYLRRPEVLGEAFITRALKSGHPMFYYFRNNVPWTRKWLARFAGAMRDLQGAHGFTECVKEQIKDAGKFRERESVLEIAYKFYNVGFEVSFDPTVMVSKPRGFTGRLVPIEAVPDLKIVDKETGEEIFVEVSELGESDISKQSDRTHNTVFDVLVAGALWEEALYPRARIKRILENDELKQLVVQLRELIAEVRRTGRVQYLINDYIEVCLAPKHEKDIPDQWGKERGITDIPIEGPSIPLQDPFRTKRIIRKEQAQLPNDKPGIVVIHTDWTLLFHAHEIRAIVSNLEEVLRDIPKLACAIVSCAYDSGDEREYAGSDGQHTAIRRVTKVGYTEQTVISLNPACPFPLPTSTFDKVRGAFISG